MTYEGPTWEVTTESKDDKSQNVMIVYSWEYYQVLIIMNNFCVTQNHKPISIKPWTLKTNNEHQSKPNDGGA